MTSPALDVLRAAVEREIQAYRTTTGAADRNMQTAAALADLDALVEAAQDLMTPPVGQLNPWDVRPAALKALGVALARVLGETTP